MSRYKDIRWFQELYVLTLTCLGVVTLHVMVDRMRRCEPTPRTLVRGRRRERESLSLAIQLVNN